MRLRQAPPSRLSIPGLLLLGACSSPAPRAPPEDDARPRRAGAACEIHEQCESGRCIAIGDVKVCAVACDGDCPAGLTCKRADGRDPNAPSVCVPTASRLCGACNADDDCSPHGDLCLPQDGGLYCGLDCSETLACPEGFTCASVRDGTGQELSRQCQPTGGTCTCSAAASGARRPCTRQSPGVGLCVGEEVCVPELGWAYCDARTPLPETCDGQDNDCDGSVDEDENGEPLARDCGFGPEPRRWECRGLETCANGFYRACSVPPPPAGETECDGYDDDCDGIPDDGLLGTSNHCGACADTCPPGPSFDGSTVRPCLGDDGARFCGPIACRVPHFDVNDDPADGCEVADDHRRVGDAIILNDTPARAFPLGSSALACDVGSAVVSCALRLPADARRHEPGAPPDPNVDFHRFTTEDRADCDPDTWLCARFEGGQAGTIEVCASDPAPAGSVPLFNRCATVDLAVQASVSLELPRTAGEVFVRLRATSGRFGGSYLVAASTGPGCPAGCE